MAPPAGTSSMLRSRRRDATLKPNRTLDRSASRGMLYENEELRLRTININAEVEKGQNYIKKLRRENEQLKREIWNLREEYERLENYVKNQEISENEEENEFDDDGDGIGNESVNVEESSMIENATVLETVVEEEDDDDNQLQRDRSIDDSVNVEPTRSSLQQDSAANLNVDDNVSCNDINDSDNNNDAGTTDPKRDDVIVVIVDTAVISEGLAPADRGATEMTADALAADVRRSDDRYDSAGCLGQHLPQDPFAVENVADGVDSRGDPLRQEQPHPDTAILQPHTACFDTGNNRQLHNLTVDEVIDATSAAEFKDKLRSVCLTEDRCYITFANAECLEQALHTAAFRIRDVPVLLMDTGAGAVILSLTGVPDTVADKDVLKCLKKYGTIIGGVDRKTVRGGGTAGGVRYVRVRPTLGAPRYLWFGSDKVIVRQLTEHETGTMNSIARRKSFRSQIKLNLKMIGAADPSSTPPPPPPQPTVDCAELKDHGNSPRAVGNTATPSSLTTAVSVQNGFRFPTDPKTATVLPVTEPKTGAAMTNSKSTGSPKKSSKTASAATPTDRDTAAGPAESPVRGRRRGSLMGFRRETVKYRGGSVSRTDGGGDDGDSDTSTICRRKLSVTGREDAEKVPWCGCWGNGCL